MSENLYLGSEFKAFLKLDPVGDLNMDDYDFHVEYYTNPKKKVTVQKKDMLRKGPNEYHACLDSRSLGAGTLSCTVTRYIPDGDFEDGLRTDIRTFSFNKRIMT